jgi:hypothetical protein
MRDIDSAKAACARIMGIRWDFDESLTSYYVELIKMYLESARTLAATMSLETAYPFFSVCEAAGIPGKLPREIREELESWMSEQLVRRHPALDVCLWYVESCYHREELDLKGIDGPGFYEPLILVFKRGGYFYGEHGFLCVGNAAIPLISKVVR